MRISQQNRILQSYTDASSIAERPNPLDYISDIHSFLLVANHTAVLSKLNHLAKDSEIVSIDIGGDLGIHSCLFAHAVPKLQTPMVIDIRKRTQGLNYEFLRECLKLYASSGAPDEFSACRDMYINTWGSGICKQTLELVGRNIEKNSFFKKINHTAYNFYGYNPHNTNVGLISSFSSLDYFRTDDFLAKAASLQKRGGLLLLWIPNSLYHYNSAGFMIDGVISALVSVPLEELFIRTSLLNSQSSLLERISSFINYQLGEGPMSLTNYISKVEKHGYRVLTASKPSASTYKEEASSYNLTHYGMNSHFGEKELQECVQKIRSINPHFGNIDKYDIMAPYYYLLCERSQ